MFPSDDDWSAKPAGVSYNKPAPWKAPAPSKPEAPKKQVQLSAAQLAFMKQQERFRQANSDNAESAAQGAAKSIAASYLQHARTDNLRSHLSNTDYSDRGLLGATADEEVECYQKHIVTMVCKCVTLISFPPSTPSYSHGFVRTTQEMLNDLLANSGDDYNIPS